MTRRRRFRISSDGGSPFRVAVNGYDAWDANFEQVIFDANQTPLRLYSRNYVEMTKVTGTAIVEASAAIARPETPAGTYPIFMVMWRCQKLNGDPGGIHTDGSVQHVSAGFHNLTTSNAGGGGGLMGENSFYLLNFCRQTASYYYSNYINYAIFRNYVG